MEDFKIGDEVIHVDSKGVYILTGKITGTKYTSPLGNIYKVDVISSNRNFYGSLTKCIHQKFLKKLK